MVYIHTSTLYDRRSSYTEQRSLKILYQKRFEFVHGDFFIYTMSVLCCFKTGLRILILLNKFSSIFEPPRGKTNNVVSEQV